MRTREQSAFAAAVAALWLLFVVQAWHTPVLLDDWYQLTWHRHHAFGLASIWQYFHYDYFNFNPRIGDTLLLIVNGPRVVHLILTPLVELAVPFLAFAVGFGRWPRACWRDLQLLLLIQVLIWLVIPIPGIIYFYRPFTTNYLFAFAVVLVLFVPYRIELARPEPGPARAWLAPFMLVLGWLAGMSNEHTGPTQMVAIACFLFVAWRRGRLRAWMVAGAIGLYIGYPMLILAPGQSVRYGGMATKTSPIGQILQRGIDGNFQIIVDFVGEAQVGLELVLGAVLLAAARAWRDRQNLAAIERGRILAIAALILAAGAMIATQFASPVVGERLFFAPAVLFVCALALIADYVFDHPVPRRFLVIACAVTFAYHAERFVTVYASAYAENAARMHELRAAKPNTVAIVTPYHLWYRTRWYWGDDFQYASLREYVANEVFDLRGIEFDRHLRWAEPSPPEHFVATRIYAPPLPPELAAQVAPVRYIPTYWEWAFAQLRKLIAFTPIADFQGHRLVRYVVDVENPDFVDPKHRPVRVLDWRPDGSRFVEGRPYDDERGEPFIRVWRGTVPAGWTESYVVGCGQTRAVQPVDSSVGPMLPVELDCRGTYSGILCDPDTCWLAGRYYR